MEAYDTLSEAINALKKQGYTIDFNLLPDRLECSEKTVKLTPKEFRIDKSFRFDVDEDPSDQSVLYAISSEKGNHKGLLVAGVGIYSDPLTTEMLARLK
ncbi:MAG: phosphoribosylpyrophosphate synthetase [Bacteroidia bacterium]